MPVPYPYSHQQVGKDDLDVPDHVLHGPLLVETVLYPGDVLYMPWGYVHKAQGVPNSSQPSFHVTIALATHDWTLSGLMTGATEEILRSVMDFRKAIPCSFGREKLQFIDTAEKRNLQNQIDSAINLLKEKITINSVADNLELKYNRHNRRASTGRRKIIEQFNDEHLQKPPQSTIADAVGPVAAHTITLGTFLRASTKNEKMYAQSMGNDHNNRRSGLQVREEIADDIFVIFTALKNNPGMHYRISDLRSLLASTSSGKNISANTGESNLLCDLALLSFSKQCVKQGALAIDLQQKYPKKSVY